ncbi:hypothetical protein B0H17DRAFT_1087683 [Mycena rosella]|uniref:DUF7330 domain-containing protein n=1 Tax=Mycena rosella TaxID=1033263 RepID=A0AAD7G544_MYCRO|nr:hypothetical protein B0H17DRAFT_1087683 [Mycena rosella]
MLVDKKSAADPATHSPVKVEEPPPYSFNSDDPQAQSTSRSRRSSVLPALPPEAFLASPADSDTRPSTTPGQSFSQVRLETRYTDIKGTYYIDPKSPPLLSTKKSRKKKVPDAIFRTRSGNITLDLATAGQVLDVASASVKVHSKSGNITLNLLPADESRPRLDLEVKINSGTAVVFIPGTYAGAIQLYTKSGTLEFLPAMLARSQVVKSGEHETLVLFGKQIDPSSRLPSDYCAILSRSGKIVVGLSGEDTYVEPPGLWQRIGGYLNFAGDRD